MAHASALEIAENNPNGVISTISAELGDTGYSVCISPQQRQTYF